MYYSNGNVKYDGDWLNGNIEGYGRFNWKNGFYYIGQWKKCVRSGKGAEYYPNGKIRYEGDFYNDRCEGNGKFFWEDGKYFIGEYKNGARNGK